MRLWLVLIACLMMQMSGLATGQVQSSVSDHLEPAAVITGSGTAGGAEDNFTSPAMTGQRRPLYRLCVSDVIEISFTFATEFNQTVTVQPDGFISLKGAHPLYVQGMTLVQLNESVKKAYATVLKDPEVALVLQKFEQPYFIVAGEVARPGRYDLDSDTTVVEAVALAGGLTHQARHSQVVLFRRVSEGMFEAHMVNIKRMLRSRDLTEDAHLHPGDLLYVPQSSISKIERFMPASNLGMYWNSRPY